MRLADRLTRLERIDGEHLHLSQAEIDEAAVRFEADLRRDGVPGGGTIEDAVSGWRAVVENCSPWARRVYLDAHPQDLCV